MPEVHAEAYSLAKSSVICRSTKSLPAEMMSDYHQARCFSTSQGPI